MDIFLFFFSSFQKFPKQTFQGSLGDSTGLLLPYNISLAFVEPGNSLQILNILHGGKKIKLPFVQFQKQKIVYFEMVCTTGLAEHLYCWLISTNKPRHPS